VLRDLVAATGSPSLTDVCGAGVAVFEARGGEAREPGRPTRAWPPTLAAHDHWTEDHALAAVSGGIDPSLGAADAEVNAWIAMISRS
jgi:hypothetical protein